MLIYFLYFIFFAFLAVEYEIRPFKGEGLLVFSVIILALLAGFRAPDVARDYGQYQFAFDNINDFVRDDSGAYFTVFEPGFVALVFLFRQFFVQNYGVAIMVFFAFASVSLKTFSFKKFALNPFLVLLLYYCHFFVLQEMTQIRIGFASSLFLVSLVFYFRKNYIAFVSIVLFAALFHYSAIFYLVVLLLKPGKFNRVYYTALIVLSFILAYVKIPLFGLVGNVDNLDAGGKLNNYADIVDYGLADSINVFNVINLIKILVSLFFIFGISENKRIQDPKFIFFLKLNILSIFVLSFLSGVPLVAFRFSELFGLVSMFNIAYLAKYLPFKKFNIWIVLAIAAIIFYVNIIYGNLLNPYHTIQIY